MGASNAATATSKQATVSAPCWFMVPPLPRRVVAPDGAFDALRRRGGTASLSAATAIASYRWPYGPPSNAEQHFATMSGRRLEIIRPAGTNPTLPTVQQVCDALQAVPSTHRQHTTKVMLCPTPHPNSTSRSTVGGEAGAGEVTFFPLSTAITQNDVDNRMMHEIGHNLQGSLWHSAADVAAWTAVATSDPQAPSVYAQTNFGDDFCEFLIIFNTVRGTPCELTARRLFPQRWDKMLTY